MWAYLGDGRIEAESKLDIKNMAPYVRAKDVSWTV